MIPEATRDRARVVVSPARGWSAGGPDRDRRLRLSRRLDWRFLLPDPHLGRVALVGDGDPTLVEALQEFSESLLLLRHGTEWIRDREGGYDVVVARSTKRHALAAASRLLRDGGSLYWEVERDRPGRSPDAAEAGARLKDLGFRGVRCHWHRPKFRSCLEIVPLHDEDTLDYVLGRCAGNWRAALRLALTRALWRLGFLGLVVPCWSAVATRERGGRAG